ncbi:MAG: hypothetical protein JNL83_02890 [Myxococcales bacterium]|nr:hypothetical protein [Myxococcales bacterium]
MSDRVVSLGVGLTAIVATAVGVNIARTPRTPSTDVRVQAARSRASIPVVLPVPQPQLLVVHAAPPPAPPPSPAPVPPPPPEPRAASPRLDVACELAVYSDGEERPPSCDWNRGFPAISADGTTIVQAVHPDDGGRGFPALEVQFLDVATARVIATHTIIDPNAFEDYDKLRRGERAAIDRRAAAVQKRIAAGNYRSLAHVSISGDEAPASSELRADVEGDRIRVVDRASNVSLWEHRYDVAVQYPNRELDGEPMCEPTGTHSIEAWWDSRTRVLLTSVGYGAGSCMCSDEIVNHVIRL